MALILAVETSCDETAAAVLSGCGGLLASEVWSQASLHAGYGGVVPEVASRNHLAALPQIVRAALKRANATISQIDAFAATSGPGLPTALLVGMACGKALAIGARRPFLAINHVEGHLFSPFFGAEEVPPHVGLVVSGGHTLLVDVAAFGECRVLGSTLDDAAGEAFDKVAKLLGLGYPGGVEVERIARAGDPARYDFPRSMRHSGDFRFSFSGLKTAVRYLLDRGPVSLPDVCASFQEAVVEVLVEKTLSAAAACGRGLVAISGGVSANRRLQELARERSGALGIELRLAPPELRTDNAAMIGYVAALQRARGVAGCLDADVLPSIDLEAFGRLTAGV
ncbi:MAG: tRNA (adenosine(37)-N6)-threonylcarbamoyltransferase complex transferase subunit TsaD [Terrimicrobiaceae bacterium]|nr:tRNA (adenosine(37)-N6)-threonylcarbamoyltransferase complex transferase subunit TsaD [Terrimicrobiaceae bacterium]